MPRKKEPTIAYWGFIAKRYLTARRTRATNSRVKRGRATGDGNVVEQQGERAERRFVSVIVLIATAGIALGTAALIVTLSILSGFENTLTENVIGFTSDVEITSVGNTPLPDYPGTSRYLRRKVASIKSLTPFVERQAILRSPHNVAGVVLRGVPVDDTSMIARRRIIKGHDLAYLPDSVDAILLSKGLAKELHTDTGKMIAAIRFNEKLKTREDILSNLRRFRVVGLYSTGMSQYDDMLAYTTLPAAQQFNNFSPTQVTGYDVRTATLDDAIPTASQINKVLFYPYFARSVFEVYRTIFAWIDLQKKPIPIILGLIILVAAFNIVSTLLLIVIEKTRSIGVLRALGAREGGIMKVFITEGMAIAVMGTFLGDAIGFLLCWTEAHYHFFKLRSDIYFMSSVPISIEWQHYAIVSLISLALALSATLIPARIASRMQPLDALRFS
jgi:lipoprotein-releasing system permease protein